MMDEKLFNKIASVVIITVLFVLAFLIIRPILTAVLFGLILTFIFHPVYKKILFLIKNRNISALIVCVILLVIIIVPLIFLIPMIIKQTLGVYSFIQKQDIFSALQSVLHNIFHMQETSIELASTLNSFVNKIASSLLNKLTDIFLNLPVTLLHLMLTLFVFFFGLRDGEKLIAYIQSLSPLSKESESKVFQQFKDITYSVIFGQIVVGILQGAVAGIAFFIFKIPNAMVLTLLSIFLGILPVGPWFVWIPVDIYLFVAGRNAAGIGLLIYGLIVVSWIDNVFRPLIVSRKTKLNSGLILISMVGGLFVFGILGLIIGPLVVAYLILLLEFYRNKKTDSILIQKTNT